MVYVLRSMLFIPGNNMRMIVKASTLDADAVILDLEDAVTMLDKETARIFVSDAISEIKTNKTSVFTRINSLSTALAEEDLKWCIRQGLDGIMLPKSESGSEILDVDKMIEKLESENGLTLHSIKIIPLIETAKGVMNANEIAYSSKRIIALAFGAVDFTRDMGIELTKEGHELYYPRTHIAIAAKSANVLSIDTVFTDIMDKEGLIRDTQIARSLGFKGKLLIHPNQIASVNQIFAVSETEVAYARKVATAFQEAESRGIGAISLDGKMIDIANYRQAKDIIALFEAIDNKRRNL